MTLSEIKLVCRRGKTGLIPGWKGYLHYNYALDELTFVNGDYLIGEKELESKLLDRTDLYYII